MTATTHSSTQGTGNWLIFRIGRVACAVPALSVASILPVPEHITALPGADAGSPGLFHHGNGTVAIVDLRHRFGCDRVDPRRGRLLLGRIGSGSYGFWVDSIVGLADGTEVKAAPLPPELPHNVFSAALRYQGELVLCSDLPPLLAMRDAGGLRHLVCAAPAEPAAPPPVAASAPARTPPQPPPATPSPPAPAGNAETRPVPGPRPEGAVPPRAAPAHPPGPMRPAATAAAPRTPPSPPMATPAPARPAPSRPHPVPAAAAPAALSRAPAPPPPAYPAPPPAEPPPAADRPWPLLLALLLLAAAGGYWLWPSAPLPPPPAAWRAPEPLPAPPPAPAVAPAAAPASPVFRGDGIQVEQNGAEITIVIERARPPAEPAPAAAAPDTSPTPETPMPAAPAPLPEPEPEPPQMYVHTVVKGDTLWAIAEHYLDDPWRYKELAQLSRIKNPDLIYPGNKVRIIIR